MNEKKQRRTVPFTFVILALAAAACLCQAATPAPPTLEPVQDQNQPAADATQAPTPQTGGETGEPGAAPQTGVLSPEQIDQISRAAVLVAIADENGEILGTGSGTIINPTGQVVTNCHVACGAPNLIIFMTSNPDLPPEAIYQAEVIAYSPPDQFDLALLQITHDQNGNPVSPSGLPYVPVGNSDTLRLGDSLFIFGYPGMGGATITYTTGTVSGFVTAEVGSQQERLYIKSDAEIGHGSSGGTAVNSAGELVAVPTFGEPDVAGGITWASLGNLMPINLLAIVRTQGAGAPPIGDIGAGAPPADDPDPNEPNDTLEEARGPVPSGEVIEGFISWAEDADVFFITPSAATTVTVTLQGPSDVDYDLYLLDGNANVLASSENETSDEAIEYAPGSADTIYIVVLPYSGANPAQPYRLSIDYAGGGAGGKSVGIAITGRMIDGATGNPISGGRFGLLLPGYTCNDFMSGSSFDMSIVLVEDDTDLRGYFALSGVPTGNDYTAYFVYGGGNYACNDNWVQVDANAGDSDLGEIEITTR